MSYIISKNEFQRFSELFDGAIVTVDDMELLICLSYHEYYLEDVINLAIDIDYRLIIKFLSHQMNNMLKEEFIECVKYKWYYLSSEEFSMFLENITRINRVIIFRDIIYNVLGMQTQTFKNIIARDYPLEYHFALSRVIKEMTRSDEEKQKDIEKHNKKIENGKKEIEKLKAQISKLKGQ